MVDENPDLETDFGGDSSVLMIYIYLLIMVTTTPSSITLEGWQHSDCRGSQTVLSGGENECLRSMALLASNIDITTSYFHPRFEGS